MFSTLHQNFNLNFKSKKYIEELFSDNDRAHLAPGIQHSVTWRFYQLESLPSTIWERCIVACNVINCSIIQINLKAGFDLPGNHFGKLEPRNWQKF